MCTFALLKSEFQKSVTRFRSVHYTMKTLSEIFVSLSLLILLLFGSGGVMVSKCACSGKSSIVLPTSHNCCPTNSSCMTVKAYNLSDSNIDDIVSISNLLPSDADIVQPICIYPKITNNVCSSNSYAKWPPGTSRRHTIALRV